MQSIAISAEGISGILLEYRVPLCGLWQHCPRLVNRMVATPFWIICVASQHPKLTSNDMPKRFWLIQCLRTILTCHLREYCQSLLTRQKMVKP